MGKGMKELLLEQRETPPCMRHGKEENALDIVRKKQFLTVGNHIAESPMILSH